MDKGQRFLDSKYDNC